MTRYSVYSTSTFKKSLKHLRKKYPHIREDLEEIVQVLAQFPDMGTAIPGYSHRTWKIRAKCTDVRKGKRAGYRIIYFWESGKKDVYLLFVYIKAEKTDVTKDEIEKLLQGLQRELDSSE